jgi:adenylate cyclase
VCETESESNIEIRLLGTPAVLCGGQALPWGSRKSTALLAYLAMRPDEPASRDHLAGLLWGDSDNAQARANLRQALTQLRRLFRGAGRDPIKTSGDGVTLNSRGLSIDAHRLASADSLPEGRCLHLDKEFLEGFSLTEPGFEQWLVAQRESLRSRARMMHELSADEAIESRQIDRAIDHLSRALNLDPLQEQLHRRLMESFAAQGRADAAMGQYERCRSVLMQELGVGPDKTTKALFEKISNQRNAATVVSAGDGTQLGEWPRFMVSDKPSIAVLPFENMSGDPEQEYFSDGIVEDIITDLSKITGLFVIARNSTFSYKGERVGVRDVCRELGVRYALEGSVRKAANRVRITAQLIDGDSGGHLWAERYDRELHDIFAVQDEVTRSIVSALAVTLTPDERERVPRRHPENLEVYEYFLRGRDKAFLDTPEANIQARALLEKAVELDPQSSLALSHLSRNHVIAHVNRWRESTGQSLELAMGLGERAVALDETSPHAYFAVAAAALWMKQHERAVVAAEKCLAIAPNYAEGHAVLGLIFTYSGKPRDAIASLQRAMRLDPHYRDIYLHLLALSHLQLKEFEQGIAALKRRLVRKPESDISRVLLAAIYGHMGRIEESRSEWAEALRINPDYSLEHRRATLPYKDPADFEQILDGLRKAGLAK